MKTARIRAWAVVVILSAATLTLYSQGLPVTYERLVKADQEPGNWLMYSNTYNGWRFSRLNQITAQNVKNLKVKWLFQGRHTEKFETTPLVVDGVMYLTRPENAIYALDALTGRQLWMYEHRNPARTFNCCGRNNRGLAILGTTLFMNTLDMHVVAVDAKSGHELWKTKMFDYTAAGGYAATGAPLVVKDKVIVGMAGGERAVSGFLDAYDAKTGAHAWRFHTIPQPGEPNFGTWAGDSWKTGGAATWNTGLTIPTRTPCSGAREIRGRTISMTFEPATISIQRQSWRWIPTPVSSSGTTSSRRTTFTTGTPRRTRSLSIRNFSDRPERCSPGRIAMGSSI